MESSYCFVSCVIGYILLLTVLQQSAGECVFPQEWDSAWYDSWTEEVNFRRTDLILEGWTVNIKPLSTILMTVTEWTCLYGGTSNNLYAFRSNNSVAAYAGNYITYLCIEVTKVTDYSYHYYLRSDINADAENARVKMINIADSPTFETLCETTSGPAIEEFFVMVKKGFESNTKQYFPTPLLGTFTYQFDDGTSNNCVTNHTELDVCTDRTLMTFKYTQCNVTQAYSAEGQVHCVAYIQKNDVYYLYVMNTGNVDNTIYYRFTCYAFQSNGSDVIGSQHPGRCVIGQTPTVRPTGGALITLTPYVTCPFTTTTISTSTSTIQSTTISTSTLTSTIQSTTVVASAGSNDAALIAGVVLGVVVLVLGIFSVFTFIYKRYKEATMNKVHTEKIPIKEDAESVLPTPRQHNTKLAPIEMKVANHLPNGIEPAFKAPLPPISAR